MGLVVFDGVGATVTAGRLVSRMTRPLATREDLPSPVAAAVRVHQRIGRVKTESLLIGESLNRGHPGSSARW
jgi:hypothetical protein